jgi:DNA-binding MarR family transcriptional regulator
MARLMHKTLDLDRYVPGLLLWLSNKVAASAASLYRSRFDIGVTDWRVLSYFEVYPWSTASKACELMGLDKAAVSRSIAFLQECGRLRSRPSGLRKIEYHTTASGRKLHDEVFRLASAREEALLTGFSLAERDKLIDMMHRLLVNLDLVNQIGRESSSKTSSGLKPRPSGR